MKSITGPAFENSSVSGVIVVTPVVFVVARIILVLYEIRNTCSKALGFGDYRVDSPGKETMCQQARYCDDQDGLLLVDPML